MADPNIQHISKELGTILGDFEKQADIRSGQMLVVGCSTSEVAGQVIGTSGTLDIAEAIYQELLQFQQKHDVELAFQCCEHLNRALVVESETADKRGLEHVSVIPVRQAGGSMATMAYSRMKNPAVVEHISADYGIDIGDTFIGMHLKHVAVPVRASLSSIGNAHVTLAKTRPKLIGGSRAVYEDNSENRACT
ncbi:TIGR01440 family protein [Bacillus lacus]|uniref:UPF0340 protein GJU40_02680 n=1 Tax=Metabacillus lacus TaxID=1983721 RepID=A0A7X2LYW9_9BACI|nr:TIGR01440 family protein [Metabacillus lacus]MRX71074.1 TIGR01440 family protein [Metabacillus lacus]